jgi:hypothetical protein
MRQDATGHVKDLGIRRTHIPRTPHELVATRTNPEVDAKEPPSELFVAVITGFKETVEADAVHGLYFCTGVFDGEVVELKEAHAFGADAVVAARVAVFAL